MKARHHLHLPEPSELAAVAEKMLIVFDVRTS
jgi:hypothetical protein